MNERAARALAGLIAASGASLAFAQQPAAPAFAPANVTHGGARAMAANCASCHGTNGHAAPGSPTDSLAGRSSYAIATAMKEFRDGKRTATLMHQIAKGYSDDEIDAIAEFFANQR